MDPGEFISRSFCRDAGFRPPASPAFQRLLYLYRAFRNPSHDWGTLYVRKNAYWSLGERFLRILAKPRRPSGSFWVRIFLAFPIRELLLRFSGIRRRWSFWLPPSVILAVSGLFEILESVVAEIIAPGKGVGWLGGQGDEWDAQNDMLSALLGSLTMMAAVALTNRKKTSR